MARTHIALPEYLCRYGIRQTDLGNAILYFAKLLQTWKSEPNPEKPECFIISDASQKDGSGAIANIIVLPHCAIITKKKIDNCNDINILEEQAALQALAEARKAVAKVTTAGTPLCRAELQLDSTEAIDKLNNSKQNGSLDGVICNIESVKNIEDKPTRDNGVLLHRWMDSLARPKNTLKDFSITIDIPPLDIQQDIPAKSSSQQTL